MKNQWGKFEFESLRGLFGSYWKGFEDPKLFVAYAKRLSKFSAQRVRHAVEKYFAEQENNYRPTVQTLVRAIVDNTVPEELPPEEKYREILHEASKALATSVCPLHEGEAVAVLTRGVLHNVDWRGVCLYADMAEDQIRQVVNGLKYPSSKEVRDLRVSLHEYKQLVKEGLVPGMTVEKASFFEAQYVKRRTDRNLQGVDA